MCSRVELLNLALCEEKKSEGIASFVGREGTQKGGRDRGGSKRTAGQTHIPQDSSVITGAKQLNLLWLTWLHYHQPEDREKKEKRTFRPL